MRLHREAYIRHQLGEESEGEIFVELFGPLVGLEAEWRRQGASEEEIALDAFDFDTADFCWAADTGLQGDRPEKVLEDTDRRRIWMDSLGRRMELDKRTASIGLPVSFPVEDHDDWRDIRHWLADHPGRTPAANLEACRATREAGGCVMLSMPGAYDTVRQLMGDENACIAFLEEPELVADILRAAGDLMEAVIGRIAECSPLDLLHVHEDFAGKSGPLVGPATVQAFFQPYYRWVWERAQEAGARLFSLDSDGNILAVLEALMACGVNRFYPMEPAAGMDIVALRKTYGKSLVLAGGIDKHVLRESPEAIQRELEYKMQPLMQGGGTVFGLDHRIPNGTPIAHYRYYVRTARELLGLPPARPRKGSWRRMAH